MNVLKDKEKQFYIDILESFVSKIDKNKPILMGNFDFADILMKTIEFFTE